MPDQDWKGDPDAPEEDEFGQGYPIPPPETWHRVAALKRKARTIPTLPVPAVLFPRLSLPIQIVDERFKSMISDVLAEDRAVAVVLQDDEEPDGILQEVCTVGIVTQVEELDDGEKNILITGSHRARIAEVVQQRPYPVTRIEPFPEPPKQASPADAVERVRRAAIQWVFLQDEDGAQELIRRISVVATPGNLSDLLAYHLFEDVGLRQEILETLDEDRRLARAEAVINAALERHRS